MEKTFIDCLKPNISGCDIPQNFVEKTFADGSRTSKLAKVFSLESFPLYGNSLELWPVTLTTVQLEFSTNYTAHNVSLDCNYISDDMR